MKAFICLFYTSIHDLMYKKIGELCGYGNLLVKESRYGFARFKHVFLLPGNLSFENRCLGPSRSSVFKSHCEYWRSIFCFKINFESNIEFSQLHDSCRIYYGYGLSIEHIFNHLICTLLKGWFWFEGLIQYHPHLDSVLAIYFGIRYFHNTNNARLKNLILYL